MGGGFSENVMPKKLRKNMFESKARFITEDSIKYSIIVQFTYVILLSLDMYLIELFSGIHIIVYCTMCIPQISFLVFKILLYYHYKKIDERALRES